LRAAGDMRGFTLLEVLIAIGVLGLGVVSALQVFGSSVQLARAAARKSEAVVHAKALMDSALWTPELRAGESHGVIGDRYRWVRSIRPAGPEDGVPNEDEINPVEIRLAVVSVVVEWDEPTGVRSYRVGTMRIVPNNG
jgi:prepilin-type N-terminal cleavage/methylation domain-containing protein